MKKKIVNGLVDRSCMQLLEELDLCLFSLVSKLLVLNPDKRLTSEQVLKHAFFSKYP